MQKQNNEDSDASEKSEDFNEKTSNLISVFRVRNRNESSRMITEIEFKKLKQALTCPICLDIFTDPVYIKDCSHRFCKNCIEKYIRSQEKKSCPTCRKKIGTKRQLRIDENISYLMQATFGNLTEYQKLIEVQMQNDLEFLRTQKNIKVAIPSGGDCPILTVRRQKSQKEEDIQVKSLYPNNQYKPNLIRKKKGIMQPPTPIQRPIRKKVKLNPSNSLTNLTAASQSIKQENLESESQEAPIQEQENQSIEDYDALEQLEEITKHPDNETLKMIKNITDHDVAISITFQLSRHPEAFWIKQINRNMVRAPWSLTVKDLSILVCRKLGLKEEKYMHSVDFYVQKNPEEDLQKIEGNQTLFDLNQNYWNYYRDAEIYDPKQLLQSVATKQKIYHSSKRQIFYDFDVDSLF